MPLLIPLVAGLLLAALCYLSLLEASTRGSAAAIVDYRRRAMVASLAAGLLGSVGAALLAANN